MAWEKTYICIDLKTFYASVECAERGRDPLTTNLVVADPDRGPSTICLAISPAMKKLGVRNRCRVFDIPPGIDYIMAKPQMQRYMEVSARIYGIYLEYVSAQDVHVYSIDECFIDATPYLVRYNMTARGFARELMRAVEARTHILATAGIGTNLFLAKVALDILAKKSPDGIAMLDEEAFKRQIWCHRPITDIWGIGPGIAERLAKYHVHDLQGVAAMDEEVLFRELGVNAEYLIDHAHGREPCTIEQIHAYRPAATSISNGQVLPRDYSAAEARTVLREMVDASALDLVSRHCVCDHVSLAIGYGRGAAPNDNLPVCCVDPRRHSAQDDTVFLNEGPTGRTGVFVGEHGKRVARRAGGYASRQRKLGERTNSFRRLMGYFDRLFDEIVDTTRAIKRINIGLGGLMPEEFASYDLFTDVQKEEEELSLQRTVVEVKDRFGKNAILKGTSYKRGATGRERNQQIGGHCA
ncbi:MAG: DNA repair protein [Coriobacteriaceae bacterium]|nr:DNA repair protein [Coriobacteriaceae bacterium]